MEGKLIMALTSGIYQMAKDLMINNQVDPINAMIIMRNVYSQFQDEAMTTAFTPNIQAPPQKGE